MCAAGFASADHLAGYAGLAPAPHDSGYRTGNLRRPQRYNRQLQRVFYTSAMISIQHSPASTAYYNGKRAQGKRHTQAVVMPKARLVPMPPAWTPRCWSSPAAGECTERSIENCCIAQA